MSIAGIQSPQGTHDVGFGHGADGRGASAAAGTTGGADTVTLSAEGRELAEAMQRREAASADGSGASATANGAAEDYPLEAYRIPDWYVDLTGGYTTVTARIGASWEESRTGYERMGNADKALYDEYSGILRDYYHQERAAAGVPVSGDIGAYYHDFLQNEATQEAVRQGLVERLANDPRAMDLMGYFGIDL